MSSELEKARQWRNWILEANANVPWVNELKDMGEQDLIMEHRYFLKHVPAKENQVYFQRPQGRG